MLWFAAHMDEWAAAMPDDSVARSKAEEALADAQAAERAADAVLARLASGWATGVLDDAGYQGARIAADADKAAAKAAVAQAQSVLSELLPEAADVYDAIERGGEGMSTAEWNGILRRLIDYIEVNADGTVVVHKR